MIPHEFFKEIWGDLAPEYGEIRAFRTGETPRQEFASTIGGAVAAAAGYVNQGRDVYFGVLKRMVKEGTTSAVDHHTRIMWADFDSKNFEGRLRGPRSAFSELSNMRLTPHIIVDSGHGYHAYWRLDSEYAFGDVQMVMKGIEREHGSDHCSDAPRILRVPGTVNYKNGENLPVRIVRFDTFSSPYSLDAFHDYYSFAEDRMRYREGLLFYTDAEEWLPSGASASKFDEGGRNTRLTRIAGAMVHRGLTPEQIQDALLWENSVRCNPPLPNDEVLAIALSVERYR